MKIYRVKDFTKGWLVGNFEPSIIRTKDFEFGIKAYRAGDEEDKHVHKKADEITAVISGKFKMSGKILNPGDVAWLKPGQPGRIFMSKKW